MISVAQSERGGVLRLRPERASEYGSRGSHPAPRAHPAQPQTAKVHQVAKCSVVMVSTFVFADFLILQYVPNLKLSKFI